MTPNPVLNGDRLWICPVCRSASGRAGHIGCCLGGTPAPPPVAYVPLVERGACATRTAPLPALVGLCPVHASESYAPVDPADPDPKCPACDCRLLVYAPRVDQRDVMAARDRRNAGAGDDALAGKGER